MSTETTEDSKPKFQIKDFLLQWAPIILLGLMLAQNAGWITSEQVSELKRIVANQEDNQAAPSPEPTPAPVPTPKPEPLTPEQIADLIQDAIEQALRAKEAEPTPAADDVPPAPVPTPTPVSQVRIKLCDEQGIELTDSEIEAGQLFRVSALGCGPDIGWHPVESGDVKLSASTDGKEFCGYLTAGQWVEFSLTDFASKTQASLRVTCLTAPQPPPDDDVKPQPKPEPKAKNVRIFVVYNPDKISPDAAIVLNANDMWDGFTDAGNDWKWINWQAEDDDEKSIIRDASGIGLPAVVVYDKATGKKLTAEELPKSVIATEGLVERYTGAK